MSEITDRIEKVKQARVLMDERELRKKEKELAEKRRLERQLESYAQDIEELVNLANILEFNRFDTSKFKIGGYHSRVGFCTSSTITLQGENFELVGLNCGNTCLRTSGTNTFKILCGDIERVEYSLTNHELQLLVDGFLKLKKNFLEYVDEIIEMSDIEE